MISYVNKYIKRYIDQVHYYDVVDEAVNVDPKHDNDVDIIPFGFLDKTPWGIWEASKNTVGRTTDYICDVFKAASKADPKAILYYSDKNFASTDKPYDLSSKRVHMLVKSMKEKECPIDGVAIKMHIDIAYSE